MGRVEKTITQRAPFGQNAGHSLGSPPT